jgi:hypothetical protein
MMSIPIFVIMSCERPELPPVAVPSGLDRDGALILDRDEGTADADGDGVPNDLDDDSDGDGLPDGVEAGDVLVDTPPVDSDGDGVPDFLDRDSDGACPDDDLEMLGSVDADADLDGVLDAHDGDDDGDGVPDWAERVGCSQRDTDGDGAWDDRDPDSDSDGCGDAWESWWTPFSTKPFDADGDGLPDLLDLDSDNNGQPDAEECRSVNGVPADTDGDGWFDFRDTDDDGDGLTDADEHDGGTSALLRDSDGDGHSDGAERAAGSDPSDPRSRAGVVYVELDERTSAETLLPVPSFGVALDVALFVDTSNSMDLHYPYVRTQARWLRSLLEQEVPDVAWALVAFDDVFFGLPEVPYYVMLPVQADADLVLNQIRDTFPILGFPDVSVMAFEAARQGATGLGWDGNCNGVYNAAEDVPPFTASPDDLFGGTGELASAGLALGTRGGLGFRDHAVPIGVILTDYFSRNPGYPQIRPQDPNELRTYGGCPNDANVDIAAAAWLELGGVAIPVDVSQKGWAVDQFELFATRQGAWYDLYGDGTLTPAMVWAPNPELAGDPRPITDPSHIAEPLVELILAAAREHAVAQTLTAHVADPEGWVVAITPDALTLEPGGPDGAFSFTVTAPVPAGREDSVVVIPLELRSEGEALLEDQLVIVLRGRPTEAEPTAPRLTARSRARSAAPRCTADRSSTRARCCAACGPRPPETQARSRLRRIVNTG